MGNSSSVAIELKTSRRAHIMRNVSLIVRTCRLIKKKKKKKKRYSCYLQKGDMQAKQQKMRGNRKRMRWSLHVNSESVFDIFLQPILPLLLLLPTESVQFAQRHFICLAVDSFRIYLWHFVFYNDNNFFFTLFISSNISCVM